MYKKIKPHTIIMSSRNAEKLEREFLQLKENRKVIDEKY